MKRKSNSRPKLNNNEEQRDMIIFGEYDPDKYAGGVRKFEGLTCSQLSDLLRLNFINPLEKKNGSPDVVQIQQFLEKYPDYTAHGFVTAKRRYDYRVTLEGVSKDKPADSEEELNDFRILFKEALELVTGERMFCWYE